MPVVRRRHRTGANILCQVPVQDEQELDIENHASVMKQRWWGRVAENPRTTARFGVTNLKQSPALDLRVVPLPRA